MEEKLRKKLKEQFALSGFLFINSAANAGKVSLILPVIDDKYGEIKKIVQ